MHTDKYKLCIYKSINIYISVYIVIIYISYMKILTNIMSLSIHMYRLHKYSYYKYNI